MNWEGWFVLTIVGTLVFGLARNWASDWVCIGCLAILMAVGKVTGSPLLPTPALAISGFGEKVLVTIGALFVVVTGLVQTGALAVAAKAVLGQPKTILSAQIRLLLPVTALSAFLNNTPVVAMFMPIVSDLCRKHRLSPSKLFLPLSYASIFGGCLTIIGTSTNIIVSDMLKQNGLRELSFFEPMWVGLPAAALGLLYIFVASRWLLPDRNPAIDLSDDPRQYTVEMTVLQNGPLVGKSIEDAGLRHLPGLFLAEIERGVTVLPAVGPAEQLQANDRLLFVGIVESVVDLQRIRGLAPATNQASKLNESRLQRCLIEAVVSDRCPMAGRTIRDGQFRTRYDAAVLAVARSGERIRAKIGDIVLQAGDTLLLEAHRSFAQRMRNSGDFFLVSSIENSAPPRHDQSLFAVLILCAMISVVTMGWLDMATAAILAGAGMIVIRCCTGSEARQSIDLRVLTTIGASFGIARAMKLSGAAEFLAKQLVDGSQFLGQHPWFGLAAIYLATMVLTELITNNAAAQLMFPIAIKAASMLDVNPMPFAMAVLMASSAGFAMPMGYQCNLMVFGPGGYRFTDYLRIGIPLDLLYFAVVVTIIPLVWTF